MPDTPGKRQRREVKAKRRQAKDERRTSRSLRRDDPNAPEQKLDENGFPVFDEDGYPVFVERELDAEGPTDDSEGVDAEATAPDQST